MCSAKALLQLRHLAQLVVIPIQTNLKVTAFLYELNPLPPDSGYSRRKNCVSTAGFSAIILGQCSSEHGERKLTLALVYIVIDLCVLSRNEKAKFA